MRRRVYFVACCLFAAAVATLAAASDTALATPPGLNLATIGGDCETTAQKFVVATKELVSRPNRLFANAPETIQFEQGGSQAGCVIVSITAESQADSGGAIQIRPLLDQRTFAMPNVAQFVAGNWAGYGSQAMNFVFANVAPGPHTLHLQFAGINSTPVRLRSRSVIVNYFK